MDFQNFAAQETSELIARLLAHRSETSASQVRSVREALEAALHSLESAPQVDRDVQDLVDRLTHASEVAVQRVKEEADATAGGLRNEIETLLSEIDAVRRALESKARESDERQAELDARAAALARMEAEATELRSEIQNERERLEAADRDLAATVEAHAEVEAALHEAEAARRQEANARTGIEESLKQAEGSLERALAETAEQRDQIQDLRNDIDTLRNENTAVKQSLETTTTENARAKAAVDEELQEVRGLLDLALAESTQLRNELETRAVEMAGVKGDLASSRDEYDRLAASHQQLTSAHDRLSSGNQQLSSDHERLTADHQRLSEDYERVTAAHQRAEELHATIAREQEELERQLQASTQARQEVEERLLTAQHEKETLEEQLQAAAQEKQDAEVYLQTIASEKQDVELQRQAITAEKRDLEQHLQDVRSLLDLAMSDTADLKGQLETQTSHVAGLEADLASARDAQQRGDAAFVELDAARASLQTLEEERDRHEDNLRRMGARLEDALAAEARLREQIASGAKPAAADMDRFISLLDASVRAVDDLGNATSVAEMFTTLVERLSIQFTRVALFRLKGQRLEGEEQFGFDQSTDVSKLTFPLETDSILARVAVGKSLERLRGDEITEGAGLPFGGTPATVIVLPITLQGEAVGVVYADYSPWAPGPGDIDPAEQEIIHEASLRFARLLVAQTGVLLTRHTHELKMLGELREYAAMLLQEAELMYQADSDAGKSKAELRKRLKDNLDCASQLYAHRAALEGTAAAGLLDEQISAAIDASTPFAGDLAIVAGELSQLDAQITAEAS
jgi:hypothetical protein